MFSNQCSSFWRKERKVLCLAWDLQTVGLSSVHETRFHTPAAPVRKSPGHLNPFMLEEEQMHRAHPFLSTLSLFPHILLYLLSDNIQHYWLCCGATPVWRHWAFHGSNHFSSLFSTFSPSTINKWPALTKLWLLLHFHFALLHVHGRGQSLPRRADQPNSKERGWKSINILQLALGHGATQRSNTSVVATAGLLVPDVHLPPSTEGKRQPLYSKKQSSLITITWNSLAERHFLKLGQVWRTKGNQHMQ